MAVRFEAPDGAVTSNPSLDFIEERIRNGGNAFWETGSCDASLIHEISGNWLVLMVKPNIGCYIRFTPATGIDEYVLVDPASQKNASQEIFLYPGGEEMHVLGDQLVGVDLTMSVISRFINNGERLLSAKWVIVGME